MTQPWLRYQMDARKIAEGILRMKPDVNLIAVLCARDVLHAFS
jgi:hypothetical protein